MSRFIDVVNATNQTDTVINVDNIAFAQRSSLPGTTDVFLSLGTENCVVKVQDDFDEFVSKLRNNKQQSCCTDKGE